MEKIGEGFEHKVFRSTNGKWALKIPKTHILYARKFIGDPKQTLDQDYERAKQLTKETFLVHNAHQRVYTSTQYGYIIVNEILRENHPIQPNEKMQIRNMLLKEKNNELIRYQYIDPDNFRLQSNGMIFWYDPFQSIDKVAAKLTGLSAKRITQIKVVFNKMYRKYLPFLDPFKDSAKGTKKQ